MDIQQQLTQLKLAYESGIWDAETYQAMVNALVNAKIATKSGAMAVGDNNAVLGENAVKANNVYGDVNTGNLTKIYQSGTGKPALDEKEFAAVLQRYFNWVIKQYGELTLRGVMRREENPLCLELDTLYISLKARVQPKKPTRQQKEMERQMDEERVVEMGELLPISPRLVLIGGAGSGKTTFLHLIASQLAHALRGERTKEIAQRLGLRELLPLPIFITLSDFNRYRRQSQGATKAQTGTLLQFISYQLIRQQASIGLPDDFFERLLRSGQSCLLLLDGLDEVADERERQYVRRAVEELGNNDGVQRMIVTSRSAAYKGQVTFPAYRVAEVQAMSQAQVQWLAKRWCEAVYPTIDEAGREYDGLWSAIKRLEKLTKEEMPMTLINTPLMTTIVAIVHYNKRRLPDQRAELYSECVRIFLAEALRPPSEAIQELAEWGGTPDQKQDCLAEVAWQMMRLGEKAGRTTGAEEIASWVTPLFEAWYEPKEVEKQRKRFMGTLNERGALLQELGGEYRFVHLTFQEFLAGWYVATKVEDDQRVPLLRPHIADSWWRETILLCVGYLGIESRPKAEKVIRGLASVSPEEGDVALVGTEIAGQAVYELPKVAHQLREEMKDRFVQLLTNPTYRFAGIWRGRAGDTLARLGDPRPGVGVRADGLPDLAWGAIIPTGNYTIGGDKKWRIFRPYQLARYPITNAQFDCFVQAKDVGDSRWWVGMPEEEKQFTHPRWPIANRPRENVSWYQAVAFCRWLSHHLKETISLPHEYQWEVAARYAGNGRCDGRVYPWGDDAITAEHANYDETKLNQTSAVGLFPLGRQPHSKLDDLSGNVWEWCASKYRSPDMSDIDQSDDVRTLRGGAWFSYSNYCRAAYRLNYHPNYRLYYYGFRVVRVPPSHP